MIRVGRRIYNKDGTYIDPSYPGFSNVVCLTYSTEYGDLGPYVLKNEKGQIMENIYQGQKCYEQVPPVKAYYSRYNKTITWERSAEIHFINEKPTEAYWKWRADIINNKYYIRYPVGLVHRHKCMFALIESNEETDDTIKYNDINYKKIGYIESRKQIYIPVYCELAKKRPKFKELQARLDKGENLLIIEVDGPHQESLEYYKNTYNVNDDFIVGNTMLINKENIKIMMNDAKNAFGHGYCLGMALLNKDKEWTTNV